MSAVSGSTVPESTATVRARFPRLLPPAGQTQTDLDAHLGQLGPAPYRDWPWRLIEEVRDAGLTGRGGAAFPVHRKMAAVAEARTGHPVVVGNAAEGEPASRKDAELLLAVPHLVLDGLQLAAEAVGATRAILYVRDDLREGTRLDIQVSERFARGLDRVAVEIVSAPARFLAGQESALVSAIGGAAGVPRFTPPPVFERGVDRRPTLVQNVETLAHLALIARYGPTWFRGAGTPDEPGTMLCTLHHASGRVMVGEAPIGTPLASLLDVSQATAVLAGGHHGAWIPAAQASGLSLSNASLRQAGASVGAGVLAALPADRCGLAETARVVGYLSAESAGQCGPCRSGLPRIATGLAELAGLTGQRPGRRVVDDLSRWSGLVEGRGACHHPDGTARLVRSALRVFAAEVRQHQQGRCSAPRGRPFLPVGAVTGADWR
jgi:NADH:ubiquinone oxidoreductase subunit F (NADH-binding)